MKTKIKDILISIQDSMFKLLERQDDFTFSTQIVDFCYIL